MAALKDDVKAFIVQALACFDKPSQVAASVKEQFRLDVTRQQVESFENYQGVIYYCFDRRKSHTDDTIKPGDPLHIGMDFNVAHMAAVVFVIRDGMPRAVDELMEVFDTPAMIEKIKAKYQQVGQQHAIAVYPDASGQNRKSSGASESDLTLLRAAKFSVVVDHSNPAVKDRINSVNAMLCNTYDERRMLVNTTKCPKFTISLERQVYDDKSQPDKKGGFDHGNDAAGYFITKMYPVTKRGATVETLRW
jgi:hypothetical protein